MIAPYRHRRRRTSPVLFAVVRGTYNVDVHAGSGMGAGPAVFPAAVWYDAGMKHRCGSEGEVLRHACFSLG